MTTSTDRIVTIRAKAFSGEGVRSQRVLVEADGTVLVWDSVAGHYTHCHSMSEQDQARARKAAR